MVGHTETQRTWTEGEGGDGRGGGDQSPLEEPRCAQSEGKEPQNDKSNDR